MISCLNSFISLFTLVNSPLISDWRLSLFFFFLFELSLELFKQNLALMNSVIESFVHTLRINNMVVESLSDSRKLTLEFCLIPSTLPLISLARPLSFPSQKSFSFFFAFRYRILSNFNYFYSRFIWFFNYLK